MKRFFQHTGLMMSLALALTLGPPPLPLGPRLNLKNMP